jgi:hypothetical protein
MLALGKSNVAGRYSKTAQNQDAGICHTSIVIGV